MPQENHGSTTNILFVCLGNSCRSQMAEAFVNQVAGSVRGWSAGSHPLGEIACGTRAVMQEKGISLDGQWSKGLNDVPLEEMDVIVTMGCEIVCPVPAGLRGRVVEWEIPDPYAGGLERYREVRDLIRLKVEQLLAELDQARSRKASWASPQRKTEVGT